MKTCNQEQAIQKIKEARENSTKVEQDIQEWLEHCKQVEPNCVFLKEDK